MIIGITSFFSGNKNLQHSLTRPEPLSAYAEAPPTDRAEASNFPELPALINIGQVPITASPSLSHCFFVVGALLHYSNFLPGF